MHEVLYNIEMSTTQMRLSESFASEQDMRNVHRAATNAGNAAAMITNLQAAGRSDQVGVWQAEQEVWHRRKSEVIASAYQGRTHLAAYAAETTLSSFVATDVWV